MKWRRRMEEELERDIAEHIAMETDDNLARGMSPSEARSAALRKFGNVARVKEDTRSVWGWTAFDAWRADVRQAFRRIRRSPGTAALAVLSLALAFAPSVTVFSVMDRLFLTPIPVKAPKEIVEIMFRDTRPDASQQYQAVSYPEFQDFNRSLRSFSGLTYQSRGGAIVVLNGRRALVGVTYVSDDYFSVLGVPMDLGPGFLKGRPSAIVSHSFWMRELAGRRDIVGRTLLVSGQSITVGGVATREFLGAGGGGIEFPPTDLWIPVETWGVSGDLKRRDWREGTVWARLRPGVSLARASAEVDGYCRKLAQDWPGSNRYLSGFTYNALADHERGGINLTSIGVLLLGILLAVACANVAGILLARAEERRHETAIRQALGASRGRLMREWMVESAVLSSLAAAFGLAGARVLMNLLPGLLSSIYVIPIHFEFSFGPRVWLYAVSLILVSTLSFGLVPAWRASRPNLLSGLRRDSAVNILRVRVPIRSLLIVMQVAAAEILLFGAGLALDAVSAVQRVDPGFDPQRPVALAMLLVIGDDGSPRVVDCEAIRDRLARIGGVRRAAYGRSVPLSLMTGPTRKLETPGQEPREILGGWAGPEFFSVLGVRILSGRDLEAGDQHAVLVNATLAHQLDPSGNAVGQEIRLDGAVRQIVGVFRDAKWETIYDQPRPRAIALTPPNAGGDATFAVEVDGNPGAYVAALRRELAAAQPGSLVVSAETLRQHYQNSLVLERRATQLFYGLGLLALLLTAAGLHGVASALFARRSKEFAIRLALGAAPRHIMGAVLSSSLKLTACGLALGLAIAYPVALMTASKLPGFTPWSAPALVLSSAIVAIAAVAAAAQPAGRVLRIQPADIVRSE